MTLGSTRSVLTLGAALAVSASMLLVPGSAQAGTAAAAGTPTLKNLGLPDAVQDMVLAGGKVWVSSGNEVDVFSTAGVKLTSVTGLLGAADLIASADGGSVYVALSQDSRIATLATSTMTETASWTTSACPTHLALAAGRVFYGFGCSTGQGAIGSVDPADGSAGPVLATTLYSVPRLSAAANTLVAGAEGEMPTTLTSYLADTDGNATRQASVSTGVGYDFAVSPDGTDVIVTGYGNGYSIERYRTADLSVAGTFAMTAYPKAVAYSADGTRFAGTLSTSYADLLRVFAADSGSLVSRSTVHQSNGVTPTVLSGTLQFSADGKRLYGIAQETGGPAQLVTATAVKLVAGKISVTVTNPKAYGKKIMVKVTVGRARTKVTVVATENGTVAAPGATTTVSKVSDAAGRVSIPVRAKYSGTLTATLAGDLTHGDATTPARSFTIPAKLALPVTGAYSSAGGTLHFHKISAVKVPIRVSPDRKLTATFTLQAKISGKWRTANSTSYTVRGDNTDYLYLSSATKNIRYRFVAAFKGDRLNTKAPTVTSKTIIID